MRIMHFGHILYFGHIVCIFVIFCILDILCILDLFYILYFLVIFYILDTLCIIDIFYIFDVLCIYVYVHILHIRMILHILFIVGAGLLPDPVNMRRRWRATVTSAPSVSATGSMKSCSKSNSDGLLLTKSGRVSMITNQVNAKYDASAVILTAPTNCLEEA